MKRNYLCDFDLRRLAQDETDCLVLGGGVAGLWAALELAKRGRSVTVAVKGGRQDSNSFHAQGGIAAAVGADDSPELHLADTLAAGGGLCDPAAVRLVTQQGAAAIAALAAAGVPFDECGGVWLRGREGGHNRRRVLHVDGDATGAGIVRQLWQLAERQPRIRIVTECIALDLLTRQRRCNGALLLSETSGELFALHAACTVLATGGIGRLYRHTSNPMGATGDGAAMAYRAGVTLADLEFVQFHPTVLAAPAAPSFLISEAVRGEGAVLIDENGRRFMEGVHPLAELAPRDIVAREIYRQRHDLQREVYLDATGIEGCAERFPGIYRTCLEWGLDMTRELLPVAPAAHYWMGGVKTDLNGQTSLDGLYACGEVACSGLHGANRLASNSLLEGIVFGERTAAAVCAKRAERPVRAVASGCGDAGYSGDCVAARAALADCMERQVGVARTGDSLRQALGEIGRIAERLQRAQPQTVEQIETSNMLEVGRLIALAALWRQESRGGHYRTDYPQAAPQRRHATLRRQRAGGMG